MKQYLTICALALTLLLTACGGQTADEPAEEPEKDHYYQILDGTGQELYTVTDDTAVAEIDALINEAGGENAAHGGAAGDPLYTYVYWQETTLHAGRTRTRSGSTWRSSAPRCAPTATPSPRRFCLTLWRMWETPSAWRGWAGC